VSNTEKGRILRIAINPDGSAGDSSVLAEGLACSQSTASRSTCTERVGLRHRAEHDRERVAVEAHHDDRDRCGWSRLGFEPRVRQEHRPLGRQLRYRDPGVQDRRS
jgi:hypothetical protein